MITSSLSRLLAPAVILFGIVGVLTMFVPQTASAAVDLFGDACKGNAAKSSACSGKGEDHITGTNGIILRAANLVAILSSVAAVIGMMIAGTMFITANGDSGKISNARQMIIYIVVGLITVVAARTIVVFVINNV